VTTKTANLLCVGARGGDGESGRRRRRRRRV